MEDIRQDSILAFDTCFTNNHIRMLKILLPYSHSSLQKYIAIYIRYRELQCVLEYFTSSPPRNTSGYDWDGSMIRNTADIHSVWDQLFPYCNTIEKQYFTRIRNLLETLENVKNMMDMMETMKALFPEGIGNEDGGFNPDIMTAMAGMFGGGQSDCDNNFNPDVMATLAGMFSCGQSDCDNNF